MGSMKVIRKAQRRGLWRGKFHVKVRIEVDVLEDLLFELCGIYFNRWSGEESSPQWWRVEHRCRTLQKRTDI